MEMQVGGLIQPIGEVDAHCIPRPHAQHRAGKTVIVGYGINIDAIKPGFASLCLQRHRQDAAV